MYRIPQTTGWTYDDLRRLPEDGHRHELLDGFLVKEPPPAIRHERVVAALFGTIWTRLTPDQRRGLFVAQAGVVLDDENVVIPDVVYVVPERRAEVIREDAVHGAPDLVAEVLSPSTRERDLIAKRALYARFGVREFWVLDPERRAVLRFAEPEDSRYRVREEITVGEVATAVIPGQILHLAELFDPYAG